MALEKIDYHEYASFIDFCFNSGKKKINGGAIDFLLDFSETYTYYTQLICNQAFYKTKRTLTYEEAIRIAYSYIETRKIDYFSILNLLPENQKRVIIAIAKERIVLKPSAVHFLIKYKLPSSSSSLQALNALVEKEIVFKALDGYKVYDVFFGRFLERYY